ncbi:hypothetical protein MP228_000737 [Amoeboaphelidium protococcarum]|nr:hypothetical protein MP228_000737 [Amoeboaphelidium protococcarum]
MRFTTRQQSTSNANSNQGSSASNSYKSGSTPSMTPPLRATLQMTSTDSDRKHTSLPHNNRSRITRSTGSLNALSLSPDADFAVIAGREVLRVVSLVSGQMDEVINLRSGAKINLNASSNDVNWSPTQKNIIVTAATNGAIVIWDIQKHGTMKQDKIINEHSRAVNRVKFHPGEQQMLLSASQDGTVKLFDLRVKDEAQLTFEGKSESVRDISWHPRQQYHFAAAFENGTLQRWDIRQSKMYERRINAHNGLCLSIDWHQDGRYLASGGRDKLIQVWDFESDTRKPVSTIQTIASVVAVGWRPHDTAMMNYGGAGSGYNNVYSGGNSSQDLTTESKYMQHSSYIASCSLLSDHRISVWNLDRPHVPYYTFEDHSNSVTNFQWKGSSTLYSVSKDRCLIMNQMETGNDSGEDAGTGYKISDSLSMNSIAWDMHEDSVIASTKYLNSPGGYTDSVSSNSHSYSHDAGGQQKASSSLSGSNNNVSSVNMNTKSKDSLMTWSGSTIPSLLSNTILAIGKQNQTPQQQTTSSSQQQQNSQTQAQGSQIHQYGQMQSTLNSSGGSGSSYHEDYESTRLSSYFARKIGRRAQSNASQSAQLQQQKLQKFRELRLQIFDPQDYQHLDVYQNDGVLPFNVDQDPELFKTLVQNYRLPAINQLNDVSGCKNVSVICAHNAQICSDNDALAAGHIWQILLELTNTQSTSYSEWNQFYRELLLFFIENDDYLHFCMVFILLHSQLSCEDNQLAQLLTMMKISESLASMHFQKLIDQLHRFELFVDATKFIKLCPLPSVLQMNAGSTTMYPACGRCNRQLPSQRSSCLKCGDDSAVCCIWQYFQRELKVSITSTVENVITVVTLNVCAIGSYTLAHKSVPLDALTFVLYEIV